MKRLILVSLLFLASLSIASDIESWQGQHYNETSGNVYTGAAIFNFTVFDATAAGTACWFNSSNITRDVYGFWRVNVSGVGANCSNPAIDYYLEIDIDEKKQTPRHLLRELNSLNRGINQNATSNLSITGNLSVSGNITAYQGFMFLNASYILNAPWVSSSMTQNLNMNFFNITNVGNMSLGAGNITQAHWLNSTIDQNFNMNFFNITNLGNMTLGWRNVTDAPWLNSTMQTNFDMNFFNITNVGNMSLGAGNITNANWLNSTIDQNFNMNNYNITNVGNMTLGAGNITNAPWITSTTPFNASYIENATWVSNGSDVTFNNITVIGNIPIGASNITDEHWVNESGDSMSGNLNMLNNSISNVTRLTMNSSAEIYFGSVLARIYSTGTNNLFIDSQDVLELNSANEIYMRPDNDVSDFLIFGTGNDIPNLPYIRSSGSNLNLSPDDGYVLVSGHLNASSVAALINASWIANASWITNPLNTNLNMNGYNITNVANMSLGVGNLTDVNLLSINASQIGNEYWMNISGDTMNGNLAMGGNSITGASSIAADNFYGLLNASNVTNGYWLNLTGGTVSGELIIAPSGNMFIVNSSGIYAFGNINGTSITALINASYVQNATWLTNPISANLDMSNYNITNIGNASLGALNITDEYWVDETGDTMSGTLNMGDNDISAVKILSVSFINGTTVNGNLIVNGYISATGINAYINASYVQNSSWLNLTGGTMLGNIDMNSYNITNVGNMTLGAGNITDAPWLNSTMQTNLNMNGYNITNVGNMTLGWGNITNVALNASDVANEYWVNQSGDSVTGNLNMTDNDLTNIKALYVSSINETTIDGATITGDFTIWTGVVGLDEVPALYINDTLQVYNSSEFLWRINDALCTPGDCDDPIFGISFSQGFWVAAPAEFGDGLTITSGTLTVGQIESSSTIAATTFFGQLNASNVTNAPWITNPMMTTLNMNGNPITGATSVAATTFYGQIDGSNVTNAPWLLLNGQSVMSGNIDLGGNSIFNGTINTNINASNITAEYWVNQTGDNMTGTLGMQNNNIEGVQILNVSRINQTTVDGTLTATEFLGNIQASYIQSPIWLPLNGGQMTGNIDLNYKDITNPGSILLDWANITGEPSFAQYTATDNFVLGGLYNITQVSTLTSLRVYTLSLRGFSESDAVEVQSNVYTNDLKNITGFDVFGGRRVKLTATALGDCDATTEGTIRYQSSDKRFYGCNSTSWVQLNN